MKFVKASEILGHWPYWSCTLGTTKWPQRWRQPPPPEGMRYTNLALYDWSRPQQHCLGLNSAWQTGGKKSVLRRIHTDWAAAAASK